MWINGEEVQSKTGLWFDKFNPATQKKMFTVPECTEDELDLAVSSAAEAQESWKWVAPQVRARSMFKLEKLLMDNKDAIARQIVLEHGKVLPDAHGDVMRGWEVVEMSCAVPHLMLGASLGNLSRNTDTVSHREPLGVTAGIAAFNFPIMIPLWMLPVALATGNSFILKPSKDDPGPAIMLAKLVKEAGVPDGLFNVIHGSRQAINFLSDDERIKAMSFVGGTPGGQAIFERCSETGKRCQMNMGAKNHAIVMPDANKDDAINMLVGAAFGAAGQRCMALPHAIFVGAAADWIPDVVEKAKTLLCTAGWVEGADLGPIINKGALARIEHLVGTAEEQGAKLLLDGRGHKPAGFEKGNFIGPTVISEVGYDMDCYLEEVFGPVLGCSTAATLEEGIEVINNNQYGNGCCIFTNSGAAARKFQFEVNVGQVGINVPIPVPLPMFSFTGWNDSMRGDLHVYGRMGMEFFTRVKTTTSNWDYSGAKKTLTTLFPMHG
jgi:malonate-semialdehyde dehydrogenase (acetylating)/methylmalonate-semialdehyde dehydrogenase